jgi:X-Pro dipeptidyl-peptidase
MSRFISISLSLSLLLINSFTVKDKDTHPDLPIIKNGEAQVVEAFNDPSNWIIHDLWVETFVDTDGDGFNDRMHVSVTRPGQTESQQLKLPVIYMSSPYFGGTAPSYEYFWDVRHNLGETPPERPHPASITTKESRPIISSRGVKNWLPRGYIFVHSSSPGTGLSQGAPTVGGLNESLAPKAVIDWLCGRVKGYTTPYGNETVEAYWSTGKVGMIGTSYDGTLAVAAATTGVEGLEAIIPTAPNTSYYHYYRSNGLVRSPGGYLGEDADVLYDFINSGDPAKRAHNDSIVRDLIMADGMDRITGDYNEFWKERDYLNQMDNFRAALLMAHGFNDWNVMPEHSYRIYNAAREKGVPTQLYYHQDGHGGEPPLKMMNRWFTRYLHGVENGVENDPPVWIVREGESKKKPSPYDDYPHPLSEMVKLYPGKGAPEQGTLNLEKAEPGTNEFLVDDFHYSGKTLATRDRSVNRLIYLGPVLKNSLHISGIPEINVCLKSSKSAANLSVWLLALPWESGSDTHITENIITRGWADPQNHGSLEQSEALNKGVYYDVKFELQPDDQIIKAGQQIALMIFSTDREFTLWPDPGTKLFIDLEKTFLKLPVVGGKNEYLNAIDPK